ncbi:MAG: hypothetical protein ISS82_01430 [Nanoarchaeota archaeon]|nr:hypothetical protein [Nanoarchaeota archaeon]
MVEYRNVPESSCVINKNNHYLRGVDWGDVGFIIKVVDEEKKVCYLDFLEFLLSRPDISKKLFNRNFEDFELTSPFSTQLLEFDDTDLEDFGKEYGLDKTKLEDLLKRCINKEFISHIGEHYTITKKGVDLPSIHLTGNYRHLNDFIDLFCQ